jgi:DNA modification methylase
MSEMQIENWPVEKLIEYANNPRKNDQAVDKMAAFIKEYGFRVPIIAKSDGLIVDGHLRLKAAKKLDMQEVPVVSADDLTDTQIKAIRIAINKSAELAEWDMDLLSIEMESLMDAGFDIELTGFDILDFDFDEPKEGLTDDDEVPEVPEDPVTKLGDLWQLGGHRLLCGDSTMVEDVERLMDGEKADMVFSDPPYDLKDTYSDNIFAVANENCHIFIMNSERILIETVYNNIDFFSQMFAVDFRIPNMISGNMPMTRVDFIAAFKKGKTKFNNTKDGFSTLIKCAKIHRSDGGETTHKQEKKVELPEQFIIHYSDEGELIVDLFTGSGSTLIACEKNNRVFRGMEFDPAYCDIIVKRWENYTGSTAVKGI